MPVQLFNGSDLTGWHMSASGPSAWTIEEGLLISPGNGPELITDRKFQDFTLHLEFWLGTESNSGVYLRGRYEVQLETDSIAEPPATTPEASMALLRLRLSSRVKPMIGKAWTSRSWVVMSLLCRTELR